MGLIAKSQFRYELTDRLFAVSQAESGNTVMCVSFPADLWNGDNLTFISYQQGRLMNEERFTAELRSVYRVKPSVSLQDTA